MTCRVTRKRMREPLVMCTSLQAERLLQAAEDNNNEELLKNVFYFITTVLSEHTSQLHVHTCTLYMYLNCIGNFYQSISEQTLRIRYLMHVPLTP